MTVIKMKLDFSRGRERIELKKEDVNRFLREFRENYGEIESWKLEKTAITITADHETICKYQTALAKAIKGEK